MKKISGYIGLGVLGTLAFGLLFYLVLSLISLGTIFDNRSHLFRFVPLNSISFHVQILFTSGYKKAGIHQCQ